MLTDAGEGRSHFGSSHFGSSHFWCKKAFRRYSLCAAFDMAIKHPATLHEFKQMLTDAGEGLVLVDFTATWCGPCQRIAPFFAKLADDNPTVVFAKVDVDANEETAKAYDVSSMPTFKAFRNGAEVGNLTGASEEGLKGLLEK